MKTQCREKRGKGRSHELWKFKMFSPLVLVVATRLIFSIQMQPPCLVHILVPPGGRLLYCRRVLYRLLSKELKVGGPSYLLQEGLSSCRKKRERYQVPQSSSCPLRLKDQGILLWATPYLALMCKSMSFLSFKMLCKIMGHLVVYKWRKNSDQSRVNALLVTADKHLPRKSCTN